MQPASARSDGCYYYPAHTDHGLAVRAGIAPMGGGDIRATSPGVAGIEVTTGPEISGAFSHVAPDSFDYSLNFPVMYLTPKLIESEESLADRGEQYAFGSCIIRSDRGDVYIGHKGDLIVSLKHLGTDAILPGGRLHRTMREILTLEKGHTADACFPRILDVFTRSESGKYGFTWYSKYGVSC